MFPHKNKVGTVLLDNISSKLLFACSAGAKRPTFVRVSLNSEMSGKIILAISLSHMHKVAIELIIT